MTFFKSFRKNKYGAKKTGDFPSKLESNVYQTLLLREKAGEIRDIQRQHSFEYPCSVRWKIDFSFVDCASGETVYCEAKGAEMETYRLKKKMFGCCPILEHAGKLEVWKADRREVVLTETVLPKVLK